MKERDYLKDC